jgi:long-chain acyl-CoA synthetase
MPALGVAHWAARDPDRVAVVVDGRRTTFAALHAGASRVAQLLAGLGVAPGGRVGIALRNRIEYLEVSLGTWLAGAVLVPFSYRSTAEEVAYMVEDASLSALVVENDMPRPSGLPVLSWVELAERASRLDAVAPSPDAPLDQRVLPYTSGTTGRPKSLRRAGQPDGTSPHDPGPWLTQFPVDFETGVHLCVAPMYHAQPRLFTHAALDWGHTVVMTHGFDPEHALRLVEEEQVTWISLAPIHFVRILKLGREVIDRYDRSTVRFVVHSASPVAPAVKREILELFPGAVWEMYGGTEGTFTIIGPDEWLAKPGSVGRTTPGRDIAILDDDGRVLPAGEVGRIFRHEPDPARRFVYAGAPDATEAAWHGEHFTIGEVGYLDEDGYLFLTDRVKDMIVRGGVNISSAEIEAVIVEHAGVQDVAVIGVPDDEYGEAVVAVVEARGALEADDVLAYCRRRLSSEKVPARIDVVDALPREPTGKLRKRVLRDDYWKAAGRAL